MPYLDNTYQTVLFVADKVFGVLQEQVVMEGNIPFVDLHGPVYVVWYWQFL